MPIKYEIWYLLFWLIVYPLLAGFYFSKKEAKENSNLKKKGDFDL